MSILAHVTGAAPGFDALRRDIDKRGRAEVAEAKRIQQQTSCTWGEALRIAAGLPCPECARSFGPHYRGPCEH